MDSCYFSKSQGGHPRTTGIPQCFFQKTGQVNKKSSQLTLVETSDRKSKGCSTKRVRVTVCGLCQHLLDKAGQWLAAPLQVYDEDPVEIKWEPKLAVFQLTCLVVETWMLFLLEALFDYIPLAARAKLFRLWLALGFRTGCWDPPFGVKHSTAWGCKQNAPGTKRASLASLISWKHFCENDLKSWRHVPQSHTNCFLQSMCFLFQREGIKNPIKVGILHVQKQTNSTLET